MLSSLLNRFSEPETLKMARLGRELKAKGIEVGKIDDTPWGRFAWLKDLDGNGLCLHQKTA